MKIAILLAAWAVATIAGARLATGGGASLDQLVTHGPYWGVVAAVVVLAVATRLLRLPDAGWSQAPWPHAARLAWLPLLFIVLFLAVAFGLGKPAPSVVAWVALNTFLVGLSEEWMFRGAMWTALRARMGAWSALWISSALFGGVHALNALVTGDLKQGLVQSGAAFMSGVFFCALRARTGSLWPGIAVHALWDFSLFLMPRGEGPALASGAAMLLPMALALPNFLYGLFLMRRVGAAPAAAPGVR